MCENLCYDYYTHVHTYTLFTRSDFCQSYTIDMLRPVHNIRSIRNSNKYKDLQQDLLICQLLRNMRFLYRLKYWYSFLLLILYTESYNNIIMYIHSFKYIYIWCCTDLKSAICIYYGLYKLGICYSHILWQILNLYIEMYIQSVTKRF